MIYVYGYNKKALIANLELAFIESPYEKFIFPT